MLTENKTREYLMKTAKMSFIVIAYTRHHDKQQ